MRIRIWLTAALLLSSGFVVAQSVNNRFDSLERLVDKISFTQRDESLRIVGEMYEIALAQPDNGSTLARTYYAETLFKQRQGLADSILYKKIVDKLDSGENSAEEEAFLSSALIVNMITSRDYTEAFNFSLRTLEKARQINDSIGVYRLLNSLGVICGDIGLKEMSANYYEEALEWLPKHGYLFREFITKNNLYGAYLTQNDFQNKTAILDSLLLLEEEIEKIGMKEMLPLIYENIIFCYDMNDKKVLSCLSKSRELYRNNPYKYTLTTYNLGVFYRYTSEPDNEKALDYFREAKNFWEQNNNDKRLSKTYNNLSHIFEDMGNFDSAFYYARKHQKVSNKDNHSAQIMEIHRRYVTASLESSQDKLIIAQSEIDLKNKQFLILILSVSGIIIVALLLFIILWQKRKTMRQQALLREAEAKELMMNLEKEHAVSELQKEKLDAQVREITSYSLLLSSKNNLMQQILDLTEEIPLDEEKTENVVKKVKSIVKNNLHTESEWEDFMLHFDKVHPHFFGKIQECHPNLTRNDIKLCAYIRIGMSIKQIARMLNLMPNSVKANRHHLRQRLGLKNGDNLDDFIQAI